MGLHSRCFVFLSKIRWSPKNKKQKQKKRSSSRLKPSFWAQYRIRYLTNTHRQNRWGAILFLLQNSASKELFCILFRPMDKLEPPPPFLRYCLEAILKLGMPRTKIYVHLTALLSHASLFQPRSKKLWFFLVRPQPLTKLFGSFWFNRWGIGNACDECGISSSIATMLVVELFDVQKESFGSPELLPLSRFRAVSLSPFTLPV